MLGDDSRRCWLHASGSSVTTPISASPPSNCSKRTMLTGAVLSDIRFSVPAAMHPTKIPIGSHGSLDVMSEGPEDGQHLGSGIDGAVCVVDDVGDKAEEYTRAWGNERHFSLVLGRQKRGRASPHPRSRQREGGWLPFKAASAPRDLRFSAQGSAGTCRKSISRETFDAAFDSPRPHLGVRSGTKG